jgi:hypothetical protein
MAPKRRVREDARREAGNSGNNGIIDVNEATSVASPDGQTAGKTAGNTAQNSDQRDGTRRSSGGPGSQH